MKTCAEHDCDRKPRSRGLCSRHYQQWLAGKRVVRSNVAFNNQIEAMKAWHRDHPKPNPKSAAAAVWEKELAAEVRKHFPAVDELPQIMAHDVDVLTQMLADIVRVGVSQNLPSRRGRRRSIVLDPAAVKAEARRVLGLPDDY